MEPIRIFIEAAQKKAIVGAVDWPGWCRGAPNEAAALEVLVAYAPRYAQALSAAGIPWTGPGSTADLQVVERHQGNGTTDFGVPGLILDVEREPLAQDELERLAALLRACWQAFDGALQRAEGRQLRKGPRGGGRDRLKILEHVTGAAQSYLSMLAWKDRSPGESDPFEEMARTRRAIDEALAAAAEGSLPQQRPRGGQIWPVPYFIRRSAWHILDHAWEIDDRIE